MAPVAPAILGRGMIAQQRYGLRRQQSRWNHAARELLPRGRIDVAIRADARIEDRRAQIAQVAVPLGRRGNARQQRAAVLLAGALIIAEEERLVLLDRPADRAAELIPQGRRNKLAISADNGLRLRERVARGAMLIAPVPECAAMQLSWCRTSSERKSQPGSPARTPHRKQ